MTAPPATIRSAPTASLRPIPSVWRISRAASATPQSDSVATRGETTVTRPAPVGLEEADVGEAEEDAGRREPPELARRRGAPRPERGDDRSGDERGRGGASPGSQGPWSARTTLSRVREERRRARRVEQPAAAQVPGTVALGGQQHAARDDGERPDHQRDAHRLAEEDERDRDGDERRGTDGDRRARRADLPHPEREEDL